MYLTLLDTFLWLVYLLLPICHISNVKKKGNASNKVVGCISVLFAVYIIVCCIIVKIYTFS